MLDLWCLKCLVPAALLLVWLAWCLRRAPLEEYDGQYEWLGDDKDEKA